MNTLDAIAGRRSIRKFKADPVPAEALRCILMAGIQAPSGKNHQPWRFVVVQGEKRAEMVRVMREGIAQMKEQGDSVGSSEATANIMEQAPVTIFAINPDRAFIYPDGLGCDRYSERWRRNREYAAGSGGPWPGDFVDWRYVFCLSRVDGVAWRKRGNDRRGCRWLRG